MSADHLSKVPLKNDIIWTVFFLFVFFNGYDTMGAASHQGYVRKNDKPIHKRCCMSANLFTSVEPTWHLPMKLHLNSKRPFQESKGGPFSK